MNEVKAYQETSVVNNTPLTIEDIDNSSLGSLELDVLPHQDTKKGMNSVWIYGGSILRASVDGIKDHEIIKRGDQFIINFHNGTVHRVNLFWNQLENECDILN